MTEGSKSFDSAADDHASMLAMLRDSADSFARGELGPGVVRKCRDQSPPFDMARWQSMASMGWTGLMISEDHGGSDAGLRAACTVLSELGKALVPEPLVACGVLAATVLQAAEPSAVREQLLSGLADGSELPSVAYEAPSAGHQGVRGNRQGDGWVLEGECRFARPGRGATGWVVRASTEAGSALFWLPAALVPEHALQFEPLTNQGDCAWLHLPRTRLDEKNLIVTPGRTPDVLQRAIDAALIASSAELLGVMRGAFTLALEHLRSRRQFGVAIGSFQALQHRAVDMYLQHELTSVCVERAARAFDGGAEADDLSLLAARAKARAADAALLTSRETVQFYGAMGYTDECDIGLYFKHSLSLAAWLGNASAQRKRYAQLRFSTHLNKGDDAP